MILSIVIPVYRNAASIDGLLASLADISATALHQYQLQIEAVFVVDGSPCDSHTILEQALPKAPFASKLLLHSRNFGAMAAVRSGLLAASGDYFSVLAADLQEPPDLVLRFFAELADGNNDVVVGRRESRQDPFLTRVTSTLFWRLYTLFVIPELPKNGVDMFACNRKFRDQLVSFTEAHTSLVGLIYWLGFNRAEVSYARIERAHGKSAWTLKKKVRYMLDSVFSFTDLPVRLLTLFGLLGISISLLFGISIVLVKLLGGGIAVPGYAATVLTVIFFGGINSLGLGVVGSYAWRTYENTKMRPLSVVTSMQAFNVIYRESRLNQ